MNFSENGFKARQLTFPRVRAAYENNEAAIADLLRKNKINANDFSVYLRAFKQEKEIELWVKQSSTDSYSLLKSYSVCENSGHPGPKRKEGDKQVPEGFYHIDRFNPKSKYHLSLGITYPNPSDVILGGENPGGDIFIHGGCETIGCLPITDELIEELYVFCVEAVNNGHETIPVTIFPCRLNDQNFQKFRIHYSDRPGNISLWRDLQQVYDLFNQSKKLPQIDFQANGGYEIQPGSANT